MAIEVNGYTIQPGADLSGADLSGADLSNMDLSKIDFRGANLTNANLSGSNLHYSKLTVDTDLTGADLSNISFYGDGTASGIPGVSWANFNTANFGYVADLSGADFTGVLLSNTWFSGLDLTGVNFKSATLDNARFDNSNFSGVDFGDARVNFAAFTGATFAGTNIYGTYVQVEGMDLPVALPDPIILSLADSDSFMVSDISGGTPSSEEHAQHVLSFADSYFPESLVSQSGTVLEPDFSVSKVPTPTIDLNDMAIEVNGYTIQPGADLSGADLSGADLSNMDLSKIDFRGANLTNANLSGSNLHYSKLTVDTDLTGADLSNISFYGDGTASGIPGVSWANFNTANFGYVADLSGADFTGVLLSNTWFSGLDLTGVNFKSATLDNARFDNSNFSGVDFGDARVNFAAFTGATFAGTNIYGTYVQVEGMDLPVALPDPIILSLADSDSFMVSDISGGTPSSEEHAQHVLSFADSYFPESLVSQSGTVLEPDFSVSKVPTPTIDLNDQHSLIAASYTIPVIHYKLPMDENDDAGMPQYIGMETIKISFDEEPIFSYSYSHPAIVNDEGISLHLSGDTDVISLEFLDTKIPLFVDDDLGRPLLDVGIDRLPLFDGSFIDGLWAHAYDDVDVYGEDSDAEYLGSFFWAINGEFSFTNQAEFEEFLIEYADVDNIAIPTDVAYGPNKTDWIEAALEHAGIEPNDAQFGSIDADIIEGTFEDDYVYGNEGDDQLTGKSGNDFLSGGSGNDKLFGNDDDDTLEGGAGNDILDGGAGNDINRGGEGNDTLYASLGQDIEDGGEGIDTYIIRETLDYVPVIDLELETAFLQGSLIAASYTIPVIHYKLPMDENDDAGMPQYIGMETIKISFDEEPIFSYSYEYRDGEIDGVAISEKTDGISIEFLDTNIPLFDYNDDYHHFGIDRLPLADGSYVDGLWANAYDDIDVAGEDADAEYLGTFFWAINGEFSFTNQAEFEEFLIEYADVDNIAIPTDVAYGPDKTDWLAAALEHDNQDQHSLQDDTNTVANIENVTMLGTSSIELIGSASDNILITNSGDDILDGGAGTNSLVGGLGDDTYQYAFKGTDIVSDSGGLNDTLYVTSRDKNDVVLLGDSYVENGNLILVSKQDSSKSLTVENAFSADGRIENAVFHTDSGAWEDETYRISSIEDNFAGDDLLYFGTQSNDRLFMNDGYNEAIVSAGHDTVKIGDGGGWVSSGDGNDTVRGNIGKDTIFTEDGDDKAYGSIGADTIDTGNGNDLIRAGHGLDQAFGGSGADTIKGGHGNDVLFGGDGEDLIKGGHGSDTLYGEADDDRLLGGHGNDVLSGGDGNDFLKGAWGADEYIGGAGADVMHSKHDEKVDTFTFLNVSDSSVGSSRDIIKSFETGIDKVDLSAIDASTLEGHQSLVYSGSEATANSVWSVISGSSRLLRADVTGDTQHDFEVQFERLDSFSQDDFILSEIL